MNARPDDDGGLPARLRWQGRHCHRLGSPLYGELLERAAGDAEAGGPVAELLRGDEAEPFESMLALRLMGAVHRRVLEGALPALEPFYPSSGVPFAPDGGKRNTARAGGAWVAFRQALVQDAAALRPLVERPVQTNEVGRCAALLPGFLAVAQETGLPLRLLEVGASAGLNLRWDRYRYQADDFVWGDPASPVQLRFELHGEMPTTAEVAVAERRGCDPAPIDPTGENGRLTLLSYLWADQLHRFERMEAALRYAPEFPVTVDRAAAVEWVGERLAEPSEGVATVVFHSLVMPYLPEAERQEFTRCVRAAGEKATPASPLALLRMEAADADRAAVALTTWPTGEQRLIARASYHGDVVEVEPSENG